MNFISALIFVIFASITNADVQLKTQKVYRKSFNVFKQAYKKSYNNVEEETKRFQIWKKNYDLVTKHNLEADSGLHTYRCKMNAFGDLVNSILNRSLY